MYLGLFNQQNIENLYCTCRTPWLQPLLRSAPCHPVVRAGYVIGDRL